MHLLYCPHLVHRLYCSPVYWLQVYHLPINEAAETLGVGLTVLKKFCCSFKVRGALQRGPACLP